MITKAYSTFFHELENNNNKEWFHMNKKAYEETKQSFLTLLDSLIPELLKLDSTISPVAKDALFRINRDIRFSIDKTPYHTLLKAGFSLGGKRSELPGFYLGISADTIHVGGGLFNVKSPELKKVRSLIAQDTDEFIQIVNSKSFVANFTELKGEQAKRLDKTLQPIAEKTPYIANKQFYAMQELPLVEYFNNEKLYSVVLNSFKEIAPLNHFLKKAFE
jgi:uncharacterized protein (TIGR02453 family)